MSFIRANHRREKIHKFGHMHLDDFLERADRFKNELIICGHFSTRYQVKEVEKVLDHKLPREAEGENQDVALRPVPESVGTMPEACLVSNRTHL